MVSYKNKFTIMVLLLFALTLGAVTTCFAETNFTAPAPIKDIYGGVLGRIMIHFENGDVYGWGENETYRLGLGKNTVIRQPTKIIGNVKEIIGTYCLKDNGELWVFGEFRIVNSELPIVRDSNWTDEEWKDFANAGTEYKYRATCYWPVKISENISSIQRAGDYIFAYKNDESVVRFNTVFPGQSFKKYANIDDCYKDSGYYFGLNFFTTPSGEMYAYQERNEKFYKKELILSDIKHGTLTNAGELWSVDWYFDNDFNQIPTKTLISKNVVDCFRDSTYLYYLNDKNELYRKKHINSEKYSSKIGENIWKMSSSGAHIGYITTDKKLYMQGTNDMGEAGVVGSDYYEDTRYLMSNVKDVKAVASGPLIGRSEGDRATFIITDKGELWYTGGYSNTYSYLLKPLGIETEAVNTPILLIKAPESLSR